VIRMKIGITGGIGSGKSTVTDYLTDQGYPVVDADDIARQIVRKGSPVLSQLAEALGGEILTPEGELDRALTAEMVFGDPDKKQILNDIMWKAIGEVMDGEIASLEDEGYPVIFVDAPLLFEAGMQENLDAVWMVYADEDIRIERVMERDDVGADQVRARMAAQMSDEEKMELADEVLDNNGTREELTEQIDRLLEGLE